MLFRIANKEDPDQTASLVAVCSVSLAVWQATSVWNLRAFTEYVFFLSFSPHFSLSPLEYIYQPGLRLSIDGCALNKFYTPICDILTILGRHISDRS